jgi:hypothetical protein
MTEPVILQLAQGSRVSVQLAADPPPSISGGQLVIEHGEPDAEGNLEPPGAGEVVLSVPSPEELARDAEAVHRVIARAGTGAEPLVIVVEAAEELRDEELAPVLEASRHTERPVILRLIRDA